MTPKPELEVPVNQGSRLRGILGAALGAFWGAVLSIILMLVVPTENEWWRLCLMTVFLTGLLSCWGYRLFQGLRSMRFAKNTALLCSALAPGLALPCTIAARTLYLRIQSGRPVTAAVMNAILANTMELVLNRNALVIVLFFALMAMAGVGMGMNGLLKYADPALFADPRRIACANRGGILYNDPSLWRMAVSGPAPMEFTVGRKLTVSGDIITVRLFPKGERSFSAGEIAGVILGPTDGHNVLYNRNNEALARFAWSMKGAGFLMEYLLERRVPLFDVEGERIVLSNRPEQRTLPKQFTVRESKVCLVLGWIGSVGFGLLVLICFLFAPPAAALIVGGFFLMLTLWSAWMLSSYYRRRLEVDGEELRYTTSLGRTTRFHVSQVEKTSVSLMLGTAQLCSREGKVLARFENNMENSDLLQIYLDRHIRQTRKERNG